METSPISCSTSVLLEAEFLHRSALPDLGCRSGSKSEEPSQSHSLLSEYSPPGGRMGSNDEPFPDSDLYDRNLLPS